MNNNVFPPRMTGVHPATHTDRDQLHRHLSIMTTSSVDSYSTVSNVIFQPRRTYKGRQGLEGIDFARKLYYGIDVAEEARDVAAPIHATGGEYVISPTLTSPMSHPFNTTDRRQSEPTILIPPPSLLTRTIADMDGYPVGPRVGISLEAGESSLRYSYIPTFVQDSPSGSSFHPLALASAAASRAGSARGSPLSKPSTKSSLTIDIPNGSPRVTTPDVTTNVQVESPTEVPHSAASLPDPYSPETELPDPYGGKVSPTDTLASLPDPYATSPTLYDPSPPSCLMASLISPVLQNPHGRSPVDRFATLPDPYASSPLAESLQNASPYFSPPSTTLNVETTPTTVSGSPTITRSSPPTPKPSTSPTIPAAGMIKQTRSPPQSTGVSLPIPRPCTARSPRPITTLPLVPAPLQPRPRPTKTESTNSLVRPASPAPLQPRPRPARADSSDSLPLPRSSSSPSLDAQPFTLLSNGSVPNFPRALPPIPRRSQTPPTTTLPASAPPTVTVHPLSESSTPSITTSESVTPTVVTSEFKTPTTSPSSSPRVSPTTSPRTLDKFVKLGLGAKIAGAAGKIKTRTTGAGTFGRGCIADSAFSPEEYDIDVSSIMVLSPLAGSNNTYDGIIALPAVPPTPPSAESMENGLPQLQDVLNITQQTGVEQTRQERIAISNEGPYVDVMSKVAAALERNRLTQTLDQLHFKQAR
jgi:hypothetical protein